MLQLFLDGRLSAAQIQHTGGLEWRHWFLIKLRCQRICSFRHGRLVGYCKYAYRIPAGRGNRKTHIDLFNGYQWAWGPDPNKKRLQKQNEILMKLDKALRTVPRRHSLCVAGDLNCQLQPHPGCIGPCVATCSQLHAPDHHDFAEWLVAHSLCVLNAWSKASGKPT